MSLSMECLAATLNVYALRLEKCCAVQQGSLDFIKRGEGELLMQTGYEDVRSTFVEQLVDNVCVT